MISVYTTAFNVVKGQFDVESALNNFSLLGDEIVIGTLNNSDETMDVLKSFSDRFPIKIVETGLSTDTFAVDGKLKEAALQKCSGDFFIQLDMDERAGNLDAWNSFISDENRLNSYFQGADSIMLPVVNLYRDIKSYKDIGRKWYVHKKGLHRGIVNFAKLEDGRFDKTKSDGCELISNKGELVKTLMVAQFKFIEEYDEANIPFVVHLGYLDIARRVKLNKDFWDKTWVSYDGKASGVLMDEKDAENDLFYTRLDFTNLI